MVTADLMTLTYPLKSYLLLCFVYIAMTSVLNILQQLCLNTKRVEGAWEMAEGLRALVVLPNGPRFNSQNPHSGPQPYGYRSSFRGSVALCRPPWARSAHVTQTCKQTITPEREVNFWNIFKGNITEGNILNLYVLVTTFQQIKRNMKLNLMSSI